MTDKRKMRYNPSLSVRENARNNGTTEDAVRYFIRSMHIDRRYERKVAMMEDISRYLKGHPEATMAEAARGTGHGINTVRRYWAAAAGNEDSEVFKIGEKITKKGLREFNDFYATHPSCVSDILREEDFCPCILEPFCGSGTMSEAIRAHGYEVESSDIVDRGYGKVRDFFSADFEPGKCDIITNPPYAGDLAGIVSRCIGLCRRKVAMLMPLRYLSGRDRHRNIYGKHPPARVYVYMERICIAKNADFEKYNDPGANREIYAWYVWEKGHAGSTELRWIHNGAYKK